MKYAIDAAREQSYASIILIGDEPCYGRVGFAPIPPGRIKVPGPVDPPRVLGLPLQHNVLLAMKGEVRRAHVDQAVCADGCRSGRLRDRPSEV